MLKQRSNFMACNNNIVYRGWIRVIILTGCLLTTAQIKGQTFAEWFKQKSTQKKYLLQQIEALQVYSGYLRKGYAIAKGGLGTISGSLLAENGLHGSYYTELKRVNPVVANNSDVKEIIQWQADIIKISNNWSRINGLNSGEIQYLGSVRRTLLTDCEQLINTLQNVVSDGKMEMSDADRLKLIQRLHSEMQSNYRFAGGFSAQAKSYAAQRLQQQTDNQFLGKTYGIK
ncbi:hypothetical protein [Mucilaginibacter agri]|uniref:TerB family tellurite resistance protein n=1 Tax=Mucilaginibacter agri TaxID=2695265 RepID=A0A965ZE87_9SPHI|nr:hypothetical protein [Mucilaginibacter agri]NCD68076.1 hypothetical protein [Mucilaginibacter agri]